MNPSGLFVKTSLILVGTTIGAGIFSLPYAFSQAGLATGAVYLAVLSGCVIFAHALCWRVLEREEGRKKLSRLVGEYVGRGASRVVGIIVVVGLLLTLTAYVVLGAAFLRMIFPIAAPLSVILFWIINSAPLLFGLRQQMKGETWATALMILAMAAVFVFAPRGAAAAPLFVHSNFFFPFGAVLFAVSGWTAVEPMLAVFRRRGPARLRPLWILIAGTAAAAVLYYLFASTIIAATPWVAPDTISGLAGWPRGPVLLIALFGLLALWTTYLPLGIEITHALEEARFSPRLAALCVILTPLILVAAHLSDFFLIVKIVGGVLLAAQYLFILEVARRALRPRGATLFFLWAVFLLFAAAGVYELVQVV